MHLLHGPTFSSVQPGSSWLDEQLETERLARALPFYRSPFSEKAHKDRKTSFLDLFFDLSFVGCLTVFQESHGVVSGADVGTLIAFIVLLWWSWTSTVLYAIRFGRNDVFHRFMTFAQIAVFAFLGAYSLGFQPSFLKYNTNYELAGAGEAIEPTIADLQAWSSWPGICVTFALGRLVLFLQYFVAALDGGRRRLCLAIILPMLGCNISGWIAFGVRWIGAESDSANGVRLGLLYGAVAFEMLLALFVSRLPSPVTIHAHLLIERMALLTLIILGEGFIALTRSLGTVVSNFGFDSASYIQVFCALGLYVLMWTLLFDPLSLTSTMSISRTHLWSLLHLPLHLSLLLWLDALIIVLLTSNLNTAFHTFSTFLTVIKGSIQTFLSRLDAGENVAYTFSLPSGQLPYVAQSLELLGSSLHELNVTLQGAFGPLENITMNYVAAHPGTNPTQYRGDVAQSLLNEVFGQLLISFATNYGFEPDDSVERLIGETFTGNASIAAYNNVTQEDFGTLVSAIDNSVLPGSRFILPFAGCILVFSTVLTLMQRFPKDRTDYMLLAPRTAAGILLCCLALLDIGRTNFTYEDLEFETSQLNNGDNFPPGTAPIYRFLYDGWLLAFQVFLFCGVVIFEFGVLYWIKRIYQAGHKHEAPPSPSQHDEEKATPPAPDQPTQQLMEDVLDTERENNNEAPLDL